MNDENTATSTPKGSPFFGFLGICALLSGLIFNEWLVAWLFAPDGALSPKSLLYVRALDAGFLASGFALLALRKRLARLFFSRSEVVAVLFGCLVALVLLACVEVPLFFINNANASRPPLDRKYSDGFMALHPLLGHRPLPSARYTETVTLNGEPLFSASYGIGPDRCRIVPTQPAQPATRALVFFGCSFAFGTGVEDEQTLPNQTASLMPDCQVYNFAGVGDGPHQMLAQLTQTDFRQSVPQDEATVVYVFIPQHLPRSIVSMRQTLEWGRNDPSFSIGPNRTAIYLGPASEAHPWRVLVYDLLSHEQIMRRLNADWPIAIMDKHIQYNADLIAAASQACREKFKSSRFYVLLYPLSGRVTPTLGVNWNHVKAVFEQSGLQVLDYRDLAAPEELDLFYPGDEHPTAKMHARIAQRLAQDLTPGKN